jgi:hypothetical protein
MISTNFDPEGLLRFIQNETTNNERELYLKHFYCSLEDTDSRIDIEKILDIFLSIKDIDTASLHNLLASHSVICCTNDLLLNKWELRPKPDSGLLSFFIFFILLLKVP